MRTCFLSSQMNAIGEFSAPLNGVRRGHPEKMSSLQKQETLQLTDVENLSQKRAARHEAGRRRLRAQIESPRWGYSATARSVTVGARD
jgi:hypothetical protein